MEQKVLALYEFASKQKFIYKTSKIKEISGASKLLSNLFDEFIKLANNIIYDTETEFDINKFTADGQVLYDGGGSLMILFQSTDKYLGFNRIVSKYLLENVPTLRLIACCVSFTGDFKLDRCELYRKNRINKNLHPSYDLTAVTPMTQIDPMTFLPVVKKEVFNTSVETNEKTELSLSADRACKQDAYKDHVDTGEFDLENLDGLAAVIYIDGNSMGKKLMKCADSDYNKGVKKLRGFSENVNRVFVANPLKNMKEIVGSSETKGFRQVIGGGDEITIICDARIALRLVEVYFDELNASNDRLPEDEKNYACAGIAVFHAKAPFTVAYEIAEAACESAKKCAHEKNGNYLDFYYCHAGITTDFETLRKREQRVTARPYSYEGAIKKFKEYAPLLQQAGRSNVKALGEAAQIGKSEYLFEAERVNSYLEKESFLITDDSKTENKDKKTPLETEMSIIYDMSEFYDLWFGKESAYDAKADEN